MVRLLVVFLLVGVTPAQAKFVYRGYIMSDVRLSLPGKDAAGGDDQMRFLRLDNSARLTTRFGKDGVQAHADLLFTYRGLHEDLSLGEMDRRTQSDPYDLESDALYVHVSDLGFEGLDLLAGRQIVQWGAADQFNPTGVLNPLDLEDPTRFGDRVPNEMLLLRYAAPWTWSGKSITYFDELTFSFVALPTHRPTQLPSHSSAVFADPALFAQLVNNQTIKDFTGLQQDIISFDAEFEYETRLPSRGALLDDAQYAGRMSAVLLGIDVSAMYFKGVSDVLMPSKVAVDLSGVSALQGINPADLGLSLDDIEPIRDLLSAASGLFAGVKIPVSVELAYPEVEVIGFDFATSLDGLGGLGLWFEAAMTQHDMVEVDLDSGSLGVLTLTEVEKGSFWKIATGMDYSITGWWYLNLQYLHGFVDEFGADDLEDYVVAVNDLKFLSDRLLVRFAAIYQLQDQSYTLYPQLVSTHWEDTTLSLGAFIMGGDTDSKFGSPASGQSRMFFSARHSF